MSNLIEFPFHRLRRARPPAQRAAQLPVTARNETRGGAMSVELNVAGFFEEASNSAICSLLTMRGSSADNQLLEWARARCAPVESILEYVEFSADTDLATACDVQIDAVELSRWLAAYRPALAAELSGQTA